MPKLTESKSPMFMTTGEIILAMNENFENYEKTIVLICYARVVLFRCTHNPQALSLLSEQLTIKTTRWSNDFMQTWRKPKKPRCSKEF